MSDASKTHFFGGMWDNDQREVTAQDAWDVVESIDHQVLGVPYRCFHRSEILNVRVEDGALYFDLKSHDWQPWTEAQAELKALMDSWRARGMTMEADEVEHPMCGEGDCDCGKEHNIYDEMGISVEKLIPHRLSLSACQFYKRRGDSRWSALMGMDWGMPRPSAPLVNIGAGFQPARQTVPTLRLCGYCGNAHEVTEYFGIPMLQCPLAPRPGTTLVANPTATGDIVRSLQESHQMLYLSMLTTRGHGLEDAMPLQDALNDAGMLSPHSVTLPDPVETWTCERGCGYDGNTPDRIACEVCCRGRGD